MAKICVIPCGDYSSPNVETAMDALLAQCGLLEQVRPGMRVCIKANLVTAAAPQRAATTHPALLAALTRRLRERGARVIIGDSPGGLYTKAFLERVYAGAGLAEVAAAGAELNLNTAVKEADAPEAVVAKHFEYTAWLDDADLLINFCKLKTHGMMGMSAAVKNLFGVVPGTRKPEYHYRYPRHEAFAQMLIDLNRYFHPALSIVDGVVAMEGNGPTQGTPKSVGVLLASTDPFQLDLACAAVLGLNRSDVPTLEQSWLQGLIPDFPDELELTAPLAPFVAGDFVLPPAHRDIAFYGDAETGMGRFLGSWAVRLLSPHPGLGDAPCVGCGVCTRLCPAKAIEIKNGQAHIRRKACIRCFCCQEFCPQGAMVSKPPLVNRVLLKSKKERT